MFFVLLFLKIKVQMIIYFPKSVILMVMSILMRLFGTTRHWGEWLLLWLHTVKYTWLTHLSGYVVMFYDDNNRRIYRIICVRCCCPKLTNTPKIKLARKLSTYVNFYINNIVFHWFMQNMFILWTVSWYEHDTSDFTNSFNFRKLCEKQENDMKD